MSDNKTAISVVNIEKTFGDHKVLDKVSIDVQKGETFVIMGGSGSGKSTLLRIMTGGIKPNAGEVYFGDQNMSSLDSDEEEKIKRRFGMSFQSAALLDFLTVEENVSLPLKEHTSLEPKIISIIAKMKLSLVGLQSFEDYYAKHYLFHIYRFFVKKLGFITPLATRPNFSQHFNLMPPGENKTIELKEKPLEKVLN